MKQFNYSFTDIRNIIDISYIITFPELENAKWSPYAIHQIFEKTRISVCLDTIPLDEEIFHSNRRHWQDIMFNTKPRLFIKSNSQMIVQLYPFDMDKYQYLIDCPSHIKYDVECSVDINTEPDLTIAIVCYTDDIKVNGSFLIKEVILNNGTYTVND